MKKIILSSIVAISLATAINADFIGAEAGYAIWNSSLSGDIQKGSGSLDFENDLGYGSSETNSFIWAYIDHPLPILPNLKIQKTNYSNDGSGKLDKNVTFDKKNFTMNENVSSSITLDQVDFIPYWRILDNWINVDLGINVKMIDGNVKVSSKDTAKSTDANFDVILPMLYTKARFDLPFTGLSLEADASYISYDGNKFSDLKTGIVYETTIGLGATIGYRQQKITLDDIDNVYGDLTINGAYAGIFYHF